MLGAGDIAMTQPYDFRRATLHTPLGELWIVTDADEQLRALDWHGYEARMQRLLARHYPAGLRLRDIEGPRSVRERLLAYFEGELAAIERVPVATSGSAFQREVWAALRTIPAGTTWSYSELAQHLGRPKAVRAVGLANGSNPIGVVVPCHRVIGADGSLTGYAGGLERKCWLLRHEGVALRAQPTLPFEAAGARV
jgi:methylated-DNA-[protein]-cysteine S-methyltransferase